MQFNLEIVPLDDAEIMHNVQEMLYPLFWIEESVSLDDDFSKMIRNSVVL